VLRVQAFLELPFVLLAYLTVCRWFSAPVYRAALRLAWPAAVASTATFCLIELSLRNPYTVDDIVIRVVSMVLVPPLITRLSPGRETPERGLVGLLALVVLAGRRMAATRLPERLPGPGIDSVARSFGWFLVLFFVPALPVRYGLNFGSRYVSAAAGLVIAGAAARYGVREMFARRPGGVMGWATRMAVAVAAGVCAAAVALAAPAGHAKLRLLEAAGAFFVCAIIVCVLGDGLAERRT
jgi:hypothetical protein